MDILKLAMTQLEREGRAKIMIGSNGRRYRGYDNSLLVDRMNTIRKYLDISKRNKKVAISRRVKCFINQK